jgi:hypothetical protein
MHATGDAASFTQLLEPSDATFTLPASTMLPDLMQRMLQCSSLYQKGPPPPTTHTPFPSRPLACCLAESITKELKRCALCAARVLDGLRTMGEKWGPMTKFTLLCDEIIVIDSRAISSDFQKRRVELARELNVELIWYYESGAF